MYFVGYVLTYFSGEKDRIPVLKKVLDSIPVITCVIGTLRRVISRFKTFKQCVNI